MNPSDKLSVCLYSDVNFLAINILENLLSRNCVINIFTHDTKEWTEKTSHLPSRNKFSILDLKKLSRSGHDDYAIFCGGFLDGRTAYNDYTEFSSFTNSSQAKTLVMFPFEVMDASKLASLRISSNTAVILMGDLLGPRIDLESNLLMPRVLLEIIGKRKLTLGIGEVFYPIFVADAVKVAIKWLFSFGPYGKVTLLLGSEVSGDTFWRSNQNMVGQLQLKYDSKMLLRTVPKGMETETIKSNLNFSLNETYSWLSKNKLSYSEKPVGGSERKSPKPNIKMPNIKIKTPKGTKTMLMLLSAVLFFPFLTLLVSLLVSFAAYKGLTAGNDGIAQSSLLLAQTFAVIAEKESAVLSHVPGIGIVYKETGFAASFAKQIDTIGIHAIPVVKDAAQLFGNMLGSQVYNSTNLSQRLESGTNLLYSDTTSIKIFTENAALDNIILAKKLLTKIDFEKFVNLVSECHILASNIPSLLGQDQGKTYMLLFENNMELRPTGGFIGSFGLVSFDGGRLTDLAVNDVYSADGQLNGHVEPPAPIKNYLGEANWWLRDSNWDPDFPTSAKRAEWFLDKEIGKKVDGVVAVDLSPIREILKITGPIFLSDYNLNISSDNLYEKTQSEVQDNFFPGTHKKASFITALSRNLLDKVAKLNTSRLLVVLRSVYESLNQRHVQIYLHDNVSQGAFSALHWDGGVILPTCGAGCYGDLTGIVEANVGSNKANYFIQRSINLNINVGIYQVDRTMIINFKNSANPALGPAGKYKTYVRLLMPEDALVTSIKSYTGQAQEDLSPEITDVRGHKEVGVLVEILGGDSKQIAFSWSTGVNTSSSLGAYGLYLRKQAGTEADQIVINVRGNGVQISPDPRFALTRDGTYVYNTTLAQDLFSLFSW